MVCLGVVWCKDIGGEEYCFVCVKGKGWGAGLYFLTLDDFQWFWW